MRRIARWLGCLVLAVVAAACRGAAPPLPPVPASAGLIMLRPGEAPPVRDSHTVIDRVVAVVNDEPIMMSELQEAVILYQREGKGPQPGERELAELERVVLQRLVDHRLQVQEARREKIEVSEDDLRARLEEFVRQNGGDRAKVEAQLRVQGLTWEGLRRELRDQTLAQRIRGRKVGRRANVTEAEVDQYLAENRVKLEAGLRYHARHLAVLAEPPGQPAAWERARAEIETILAELRAGADFAVLAGERSRGASAASGDDLGWLARGELEPVFEEPLLKLRKGEVTEPIRSGAGYHLFKLEGREELTPQMLADARQQAREILLQRKAQERLEEWVEGLRRRALIAIRL